VKLATGSARDYAMRLTPLGGGEPVSVPARDTAALWPRRWHSAYSCCFCDDIFGECADLSVMDAWIEPFVSDGRGTSLVVARSALAHELVAALSATTALQQIDPEQVIASQAGMVVDKRTGVALRVAAARCLGLPWRAKRYDDGPHAGVAMRLGYLAAFAQVVSECASSPLSVGAYRVASALLNAASVLISAVAGSFRRTAGGSRR
jgi:hypothetical protein